MTAHVTKDWWICFSDANGNVRHKPLGEWLLGNQLVLIERGAEDGESVDDVQPVALAATLEGSQEAGRRFKRRVRERRENAKNEFWGSV